jgi:iron complex transport system permease protein
LSRPHADAGQASVPEPETGQTSPTGPAGQAGPAGPTGRVGAAGGDSANAAGHATGEVPRRGRRTAGAITGATAILIVALIAGVSIGPVSVPLGAIANTLLSHLPWHPAVSVQPIDAAIIWQIRLPRVVLGALVGAMLSGGGAAYQGVFRNPPADPHSPSRRWRRSRRHRRDH